MVTGWVMVGSTVSGLIVWTPVPGMLNWMMFGPVVPFELRMAWRSEPVPMSLVLVTVNVLAIAPLASKRATQLKRTIPLRFMRKIVLKERFTAILVFMVIGSTGFAFG